MGKSSKSAGQESYFLQFPSLILYQINEFILDNEKLPSITDLDKRINVTYAWLHEVIYKMVDKELIQLKKQGRKTLLDLTKKSKAIVGSIRIIRLSELNDK